MTPPPRRRLQSPKCRTARGVSTAALVSFILGLGGSDESSEPLTIKDTFAVPADDAAEPTPLT